MQRAGQWTRLGPGHLDESLTAVNPTRRLALSVAASLLAFDAGAFPLDPFGLSPGAALEQALEGCQAVINGADPEVTFSGLAPLDSPAPVSRENGSLAIQDMVAFFGDGRIVRSGVVPLAGLVVVVSPEGDLCQAISLSGPEMAPVANQFISGSEAGWRWTGPGRASRLNGQAVEIIQRPAAPESVAHIVVRFRRD